jgi:hypothetical protein
LVCDCSGLRAARTRRKPSDPRARDDALLLALHALADLVPIPLPFGTGTSLKTIEAMAGGKVVLGRLQHSGCRR